MKCLGDLVAFKRMNAKARWVPLVPGMVECARCGWTMDGGTEPERMAAFMAHPCQGPDA